MNILSVRSSSILILAVLLFIPPVIFAQTNLEEVIDDMYEAHEGRPHGVPEEWDWAVYPRFGAEVPPEDWTAAIAWGQLYEWLEGNPATNTRVQIRDLEIYYLSNVDLEWHVLQKNVLVEGAAYVEDFAGDINKPADIRQESDGSISVTAGEGYNFHFWPKQGRTEFPANEIKGIFSTVRARLILDDQDGVDDREIARYVMGVGGDWWESMDAVWDNWTTNADMGIGRFRFVRSEWKSFNMISIPEDSVRKYPPPFHTTDPYVSDDIQNISLPRLIICPNPVSQDSFVEFDLMAPSSVQLAVHAMDGSMMLNLCEQEFPAGKHTVRINPTELQAGMYVLKSNLGEDELYSKFLLLE